ncbi:MAG: metalloprotease TldD [Gammaproteobacteria bacterium]|nr:metalloprotease TldD [Gammaproteobacteria bacterium]MCH9717741.1 metalloprotease TldD [Gammaproteobacteria bacterium]MCH9744423.1 metalloprotease TldD [Gammaproteobacteria bacterium]
MSNIIKTVSSQLLDQSGVNQQQLESAFDKALGASVDAGDVYLQSSYEDSWFLEDGIVKGGDYSVDRGFGLRVISGEKVGFAYADDITLPALNDAAKSARSIVQGGGSGALQVQGAADAPMLYTADNPIHSLSDQDKVALLKQIDRLARKRDPRVKQVMVRLSGFYDVIMVLRSDGHMAADIRPLVHLSLSVIVEQNGRRERGSAGGGGRENFQIYTPELVEQYVDKAVNQALQNLESVPAPAGSMPVVLGPGWPGVLLHEAVGHGLEGDFNRKGSSAFSGRMGERVASSLCTIVDDGTIPGRRGSLTVDDEGTPSQNTVLIEKGILKNYMQDRHNARLMGMEPTGNGRREAYNCAPMPRMTNTYMLPGESDPEEIIASVEQGIYATDFAGGQVDITSGKFVFSLSSAFLIEKGKLTQPIKGATLIGDGPEVLTRVSMVGNDLQLDSGIGNCGKDGQSVEVGVGQPTLKVDKITVGGSQ